MYVNLAFRIIIWQVDINNLREKFSPGPGFEPGYPALDSGSNPGPGENFSLKLLIYIIRPRVLYASELWRMLKKNEQREVVSERKVLWKIIEPKNKNREWGIKNKRDLYDLFNEPRIINVIKISRLSW